MTGSLVPEEEEEEEPTFTVSEYLQSIDDDEQEADLVLGGDDGEECTYSHGYMSRQAVFSCLTCCPRADQMAGFCTACSLDCHDGHEVVELWTKRNFRCDCGNSKFPGNPCHLQPVKDAENSKNMYGQNFRGLYCSCAQPYPDPAKEAAGVEETMLQCSVCEDWFHQEHLCLPPKCAAPEPGEYEDMICAACVEKRCPFLLSSAYSGLRVPLPLHSETADDGAVKEEKEATAVEEKAAPATASVAPDSLNPTSLAVSAEAADKRNGKEDPEEAKADVQTAGAANGSGPSDCHVKTEGSDAKPSSSSATTVDASSAGVPACKLGAAGPVASNGGAIASVFFREGWRLQLCTCPNCQKLLADSYVPFLLDSSDTLSAYFAAGKRKRAGQPTAEERAQQAFLQDPSMSHVQKVEMIHGFNQLTEHLTAFLGSYGESGKVVTAADVHSFFGELTEKRRRLR